ncbi:MAG TPA: sulfite exporter TauE/SafE family protein [Burkholderiales bacterium]|nr:sulfite exporter TauE/SafE family protein [Burkholderiales bacterium]
MTPWEIAYCGAVLLVAYSLRGSTGFGGLVGMPLLALVIPVKVLAPAWTLLGIASSATILGGDRAYVDKRAFVSFLPWCIVGIGAGLYLFKALDALMLARALGVLVLLYAGYMAWLIAHPASRDPLPPGAVRPAAGVLSGAVGTMFGAMASIFFALYLNACALEKQAFRATISAMLLALSLIRLAAYAAVGELSAEALLVFAAALPAMGLGIYLGGRIHARMSEGLFKGLVCAILVVCAIPLLLR